MCSVQSGVVWLPVLLLFPCQVLDKRSWHKHDIDDGLRDYRLNIGIPVFPDPKWSLCSGNKMLVVWRSGQQTCVTSEKKNSCIVRKKKKKENRKQRTHDKQEQKGKENTRLIKQISCLEQEREITSQIKKDWEGKILMSTPKESLPMTPNNFLLFLFHGSPSICSESQSL